MYGAYTRMNSVGIFGSFLKQGGPQYRPQNTIVLIIGTEFWETPISRNSPGSRTTAKVGLMPMRGSSKGYKPTFQFMFRVLFHLISILAAISLYARELENPNPSDSDPFDLGP